MLSKRIIKLFLLVTVAFGIHTSISFGGGAGPQLLNEVFPNSKDGGILCSGDFNTDGYVNVRDVSATDQLVAVWFK